MKRALVLGGGGLVGIAWEMGIVAGFAEAGIDLRDADLIVGTSAGSVIGTHLAHGRDPATLEESRRGAAARPPSSVPPDVATLTAVFQLWASFDEMTQDACAQVGRLALAAKTVPEDEWLAGFAANDWPGWPEKPLLITAVDCESGAFKVFDRQSGVEVHKAVTASCSVPGMVPPVTIGGRRYMDGGVRSGTSGDLAQRIEPDRVLIIAPLGSPGAAASGVGRVIAKQIAREKGELEGVGAKVFLIQLDEAAREAVGGNLMDPARAAPAAEAARAHMRRIADEVREWWGK
jgi:NTE family protein